MMSLNKISYNSIIFVSAESLQRVFSWKEFLENAQEEGFSHPCLMSTSASEVQLKEAKEFLGK